MQSVMQQTHAWMSWDEHRNAEGNLWAIGSADVITEDDLGAFDVFHDTNINRWSSFHKTFCWTSLGPSMATSSRLVYQLSLLGSRPTLMSKCSRSGHEPYFITRICSWKTRRDCIPSTITRDDRIWKSIRTDRRNMDSRKDCCDYLDWTFVWTLEFARWHCPATDRLCKDVDWYWRWTI